jgi:hypothetical protein
MEEESLDHIWELYGLKANGKATEEQIKKLYNWAEKVISELRSVSDQDKSDGNISEDDLPGREGKAKEAKPSEFSFCSTFSLTSSVFESITSPDRNLTVKPAGENLPDGETESSSES